MAPILCEVSSICKASQAENDHYKMLQTNGLETSTTYSNSKTVQENCTKRKDGDGFKTVFYIYVAFQRIFKTFCGVSRQFQDSSSKMSNSPLYFIVFCSLLCVVSAHSFGKDECDPDDVNSCSFGATCQEEHVRGHRGRSFYRCKCPQINCFSAGLYDPVCGDDGIFEKPFFNVLCLMLQECEMQKPIRQVCYGICGSESCKKISPESMHHGPCPRKDANLCLNGGLCVHHKLLDRSSCRCPDEFTGDRCQKKIPPPPRTTKGDKGEVKCDSSQSFLTIFAVVLLGLVLLFIIACLCCRNRRSGKEEEHFWSTSRLDQEETTPLRETTRSDYLFPEKPKEITETTN